LRERWPSESEVGWGPRTEDEEGEARCASRSTQLLPHPDLDRMSRIRRSKLPSEEAMFRSVAAAAIAAGVISTALVGSAQARITEIKIDTVEPFAEGQPFGEAGSYERVRGIAKGELDPQSPQNQPIVDLDKAPRNARGFVEYEIFSSCVRSIRAGAMASSST